MLVFFSSFSLCPALPPLVYKIVGYEEKEFFFREVMARVSGSRVVVGSAVCHFVCGFLFQGGAAGSGVLNSSEVCVAGG